MHKNPVIDTVKGMTIILVVYGHVIQRTMSVNGADFFLNPAFKAIYTFHMPLFVFISGYLMAFSLSRKTEMEAFKARCKSLLVPLICWGILGMLTNYFLNTVDGSGSGGQWLSNSFSWFLFVLFISSCILLYSVRLQKRMGVIIFAAVYFLILIIPFNNYCWLYYIKWFYLFYMAGYFINKYGIKTITNKSVSAAAFFIALIIFILLLSHWAKTDYIYINKMNFLSNHYGHEVLRIIYRYVLGFLGILITFYIGAYFSKARIGHLLGTIGIYSLDIYLIQRYIVEGIYPRLAARAHIDFDFNSPFFLFVYVPLLTIFFVGTCVLISKTFIRNNHLLNKLLLGGRN